MEGLKFLDTIADNSIDLILTDPPYIISKDSGMDKYSNQVKEQEENGIEYIHTEEEWEKYKLTIKKSQEEIELGKGHGWSKENWLKYGNILGKKYCNITDFGEWDKEFTLEILKKFIDMFYQKLKKGGTCIIFFDCWKTSYLKDMMEKISKTKKAIIKVLNNFDLSNGLKQIPNP